MNTYICIIRERENLSAEEKKVTVKGHTKVHAVHMAEIYFPDYHILKIALQKQEISTNFAIK